uniref:Predicted protein n=1 Tax=Physcomitrium patens TaxID=3218 RepID=A9U3Y4_PHYPA
MDPSIASMFQAFSLSMQQQQSNDRKEALATKALQAVVNKIDQFDGRNISRYLRCYVRKMKLNRVFEKKMVALFGLAMIPEIRDHITSITDRYGNSWEDFSHALKDEYFLEDADRVTKKLFLGWIEWPNKNLQYSQLSKVEKLTLEPNKVDLFLQAADGELQEKIEPLLEVKEEDEGLTTKWKNVEDAVGLLTKKERRKDRSNIPKTVQAPKALGGMRALVQDYLKEHETAVRESASYGARVDDEIGGSTETSEFWASAVSTIQEGKLPREALLRTAATIREANSRRQGSGGSFTRIACKGYLNIIGRKKKETKDKGKSIAYKLLSDIEAATNLKGVLEERILNAKVEFTLKEALEIAKKEFHDVIIDSIKRKRQLMGETGMSHAIHARIYKEEEEVDIGYKQPTNEKNGYNQRVRFEDYCDKEMETLSHYTRKHWARTTTEAIRAANNTRGELYGACLDVKIWIGDVATEQHFFVQDTISYPLILGQPYITATRMETKVLDDGSAYARVRSEDGRKAVQFLTVPPNHERNRDRLREKPLSKIVEGFKDFEEVYTILESFQAPEVTVETRYKTADKKVKFVAGPLPEDSKEQMGEASEEASLRDPMSIGHQFTRKTFEELKIGSDGSLLTKEITCFKKMLAKQGRSFAFESHEIGCVDPNIVTPMVIFTVPHVP